MSKNGWGLEVVRGAAIGTVFPVPAGASLLGNALGGERGIDLAPQEGSSARRMAARQARVDCSPDGLALLDLDSPGGTFVNRQRVFPGRPQPLKPGDVIQLGPVQLKVVVPAKAPAATPSATKPIPVAQAPPPRPSPATASAPPPKADVVPTRPRAGALAIPFVSASGTTCRTWDDFLTASAQNWSALREELESGRLAAFLRTAGRDDLVPPAAADRPPDERLDAWLGRLPTTRPAEPDCEVHPRVLRVRAGAGGGTTRAKLTVTNTGYRLLRSTVRVETADVPWLKVAPAFNGVTFTTSESTDVPVEVAIPDVVKAPLSAFLVVENQAGVCRVEVRVEPVADPQIPTGDLADAPPVPGADFLERFAGWNPVLRACAGALVAAASRAALIPGDRLLPATPAPSLGGAALVLGGIGGLLAFGLAFTRGGFRDAPASGFAGAFAGVLLATVEVAACRAIEPLFGLSPVAAVFLWLGLGGFLGFAAGFWLPTRADAQTGGRS